MTLANWIHPLLFTGRAAVWSPLDLPGLVLWLDANQITGVPDGGDISTWLDLSGNARHATQAVALDKPHFREAYQNGLSVAEFDGANHWMTLDFSTPVPAADHTLIIAYKQRDALTNPDQRFFDFIPPAGELSINSITSTVGKIGYWQGAWRHVANAINGEQVVAFQMEAGNASLFRNGIPLSAGGILAQRALSTAVSIGANTIGSYPFDGYIFEALICSPMLGDVNRALAENYLIAKWADEYFYYLVYDTFTDINGTDLDAHVPERGSWTEVDTGGLCDIQSNKAQITGAGVFTDPLFYAGPFDRATGQEFVFTIKPGQTTNQLAVGLWDGLNFDPAGAGKEHIMWFYTGGKLYCREAAEPEFDLYTTDEVECKIVLKAVGAEYWYNGVKIRDLAVNSGGPLYVGAVARGGTWDFDFMSYDMPSL